MDRDYATLKFSCPASKHRCYAIACYSGISFKKQHIKNNSFLNYNFLYIFEKEIKESELAGIHKYSGQLKDY